MELTKEARWFLSALGASVNPSCAAPAAEGLTEEQLSRVWNLAYLHRVMPMVYEAVSRLAPREEAAARFARRYRGQIVRQVYGQTVRTQHFLRLYEALRASGVRAVVLKGILCRCLYPKPDYRASSDEDLFAEEAEFSRAEAVLEAQGLELTDPAEPGARKTAQVLTFVSRQTGLRVELHRHLFSPDSKAYGALEPLFADGGKRAVEMEVEGVRLWSLCPTDHMLYLFFHSYKHFLHSGFGIRQVCDICMYAHHFRREIDWERVGAVLEQYRARVFAVALFEIGAAWLGFPRESFLEGEAPEISDLLADILSAGVYGSSSLDRQHSSLITLNAVSAPGGERAKALPGRCSPAPRLWKEGIPT